MEELEDATPPAPARAGEQSGRGTRAAFVVALALLAALLATSARTAPPPEGRLGQRVELMALIAAEQSRNEAMAAKVEELADEIEVLERALADEGAEISGLQSAVDALAAPAGLTPVRGPGVTVTLTDSGVTPPAGEDLNDYVIHEEDLQAVINALWAGGAEAMAVNGHRVLATTAIRCVGNVLLLHGATHSPPYVIEAVGDGESMTAELAEDVAVVRFEQAVQRFELGYEVAPGDLALPAFEGGIGMQRARPAAVRG